MRLYTHTHTHTHINEGLSGRSQAIVNIMRMACMASCKLAAKESGLECAYVNNDDFTVLVSRGGRCH